MTCSLFSVQRWNCSYYYCENFLSMLLLCVWYTLWKILTYAFRWCVIYTVKNAYLCLHLVYDIYCEKKLLSLGVWYILWNIPVLLLDVWYILWKKLPMLLLGVWYQLWKNTYLCFHLVCDTTDLHTLDWSCRNTIAVALGPEVYLWNATDATITLLLSTSENEYVSSVSWITDGSLLSVGLSDGNVQVCREAHVLYSTTWTLGVLVFGTVAVVCTVLKTASMSVFLVFDFPGGLQDHDNAWLVGILWLAKFPAGQDVKFTFNQYRTVFDVINKWTV